MDIMTLAAKITLDTGSYEKGLKKAEGNFSKLGKSLSAKTVALGTFAGNMLTKATTASFNAISNAVKNATKAFSDYEQLVGGVKTLFGTREIANARDYAKQIGLIGEKVDKTGKTITTVNKKVAKSLFGDVKGLTAEDAISKAYAQAEEAQKRVMDNANKAYMTAGVSMNHYMETATSFAAAMNQATGGDTVKSAELVDLAIRDMADNANKMGTSMDSVENAYRGFAKGNYTMLDNLKLGYGGTKTEMARLLKDASAITGEKYKIGNMTDMVKAINAIQKRQGITGTTEKEAKGTIEGSKNMLKSAWENVLTALAAPEDIDLSGAIASLTDSAKTYLNNLFPVVSKVMDGLGTFMEEVLPDIMEKIPEMFADFAPKLVRAGKKMFQGFSRGLKRVAKDIKWPSWDDMKGSIQRAWNTVTDGFDKLGKLIFGEKADGTTNWPSAADIIKKIKDIWKQVTDAFDNLGGLIFGKKADGTTDWPSADEIFAKINGIWDDVLKKAETLVPLVFGKDSAVSESLTNAIHFIKDFGDWVIENQDTVAKGIAAIGAAFAAWEIAKIASSLNPIKLAFVAISAIAAIVIANWDKVKEKVQQVSEWFTEKKEEVKQWVTDNLITPFNDVKAEIESAWNKLKEKFVDGIAGIVSTFTTWVDTNLIAPIQSFIDKVDEAARKLMELFGIGSTGNDDYNGPDQSGEKPEPDVLAIVDPPADKNQVANLGPNGETVKKDRKRNTNKQIEEAANGANKAQKNLNGTVEETARQLEEAGKKGTEAGKKNSEGMKQIKDKTDEAELSVEELKAALEAIVGTYVANVIINISQRGSYIGAGPQFNPNSVGAPKVGGYVVTPGSYNAKGDWNVPYDDYITRLHRGEMVLTKSQARQYREGNSGGNIDVKGLAASIVAAVREGMAGASVNSYLDGKSVTSSVNRRTSNKLRARRFAEL